MKRESGDPSTDGNSGAVPAAVDPIRRLTDCVIESEATFRYNEREGINNRDEPEDLP